uniref:Uncharacterized protein n=1 Tax=virus sp. ctrcb4 TaxID=2825824 RepID=A0A8S5RQ45_9VIRU|nr:MAG TPA: hypothetical protein [virus sp. ctrcb4]
MYLEQIQIQTIIQQHLHEQMEPVKVQQVH